MEAFPIKKNQNTKLKINLRSAKQRKQVPNQNMPVAICTCGARILVVPDVAAMDRAVKNHLSKDKNANEQYLIKQVLKVASAQA